LNVLAEADVEEISDRVVTQLGPLAKVVAVTWAESLRNAAGRVCPLRSVPDFRRYDAFGTTWYGFAIAGNNLRGDTGVGFKNGRTVIRVNTAYARRWDQWRNSVTALMRGEVGAGRPDWYFGLDQHGYVVISQGGHARQSFGQVGGQSAVTSAITDLFENTLPYY
jgi:hypothetical protein